MYILGSFAFSACLIGQLKFVLTCLVIGMEKAMRSFRKFEREGNRKKANRKVGAMVRRGLISEEDAAGLFRKDEKASAAHKNRLQQEEEARRTEWGRTQHDSKGAGKRKDNSNQGQAESHTSQGGLQYKGEGKGGSLGQSVGPSRGNTAEVANGGDVVVKKNKTEEQDWMKGIPAARPRYTDDTEIWKDCFENKYFYKVPFWDGKDTWSLDIGSHALWKKAPLGPRGGQSTKMEVFHAQVHGWRHNDELGKWDVVVS